MTRVGRTGVQPEDMDLAFPRTSGEVVVGGLHGQSSVRQTLPQDHSVELLTAHHGAARGVQDDDVGLLFGEPLLQLPVMRGKDEGDAAPVGADDDLSAGAGLQQG